MSETMIPDWTLGWRMKRALAHAGLTTDDMAAELGVSRSTISAWVNDHGAEPRIGYLKLWALRTGVPLEWLVSGGLRRAQIRDTAPILCRVNFGSGHHCSLPVGHSGPHLCWCGVPSEATLDLCRSGLGLAA